MLVEDHLFRTNLIKNKVIRPPMKGYRQVKQLKENNSKKEHMEEWKFSFTPQDSAKVQLLLTLREKK